MELIDRAYVLAKVKALSDEIYDNDNIEPMAVLHSVVEIILDAPVEGVLTSEVERLKRILASYAIQYGTVVDCGKYGYRKQIEGEWVENEDDFWILCSSCGVELWDEQEDKKTPYCPHCGAKMKGGE